VVLGELVEACGQSGAKELRAIHLSKFRTLFPTPGTAYYMRPNGTESVAVLATFRMTNTCIVASDLLFLFLEQLRYLAHFERTAKIGKYLLC